MTSDRKQVWLVWPEDRQKIKSEWDDLCIRMEILQFVSWWSRRTFTLISSLHHDVSIQLLQLSVEVLQPAVGAPQLTVHLYRSDQAIRGQYPLWEFLIGTSCCMGVCLYGNQGMMGCVEHGEKHEWKASVEFHLHKKGLEDFKLFVWNPTKCLKSLWCQEAYFGVYNLCYITPLWCPINFLPARMRSSSLDY